MSTFNNINITYDKVEDNNNNNNVNNQKLYNSIIDQLESLCSQIDQCNPEVRKIVWNELYRLSMKKTFNKNQPQQIYNQFFQSQNNCTNIFTPYFISLISGDINYHSIELLYKSFKNSLKNNKNLLNNQSSSNNNNNNNNNCINDLSISSNIFLTSSLWGYSYPAAIQQLTLICYWLPVIKKLSKQQKKRLWQTCLMFPLFQKQQQPFENPGYFKTPDYQNIISKWFECPIENLNSITIFFSAIGYLVELNIFKNDYYYPQSNIQVFSSTFLPCEQQQQQSSSSTNVVNKSGSAPSSPNKLKNSTSSLTSSCDDDDDEIEFDDNQEDEDIEIDEEEIRSAKKLKKSNSSTNTLSTSSSSSSSTSSNMESPLMYDGVPSLSPMSSPKTRLRSFSSTSISSTSSPLLSFGSLHDHPSYYEEIEINHHLNNQNINNNIQKNNKNNKKQQPTIQQQNHTNNVQSINSLIDNIIKKESENSSLLSCLTKKSLVQKSNAGASLLPSSLSRSSSIGSPSSTSTTPLSLSSSSSILPPTSQNNNGKSSITLPSLPSSLLSSPIKSKEDNNNSNKNNNGFSFLDALALTATSLGEMKNEKPSPLKSTMNIAPLPTIPCSIDESNDHQIDEYDHHFNSVGQMQHQKHNRNQFNSIEEIVPSPINNKIQKKRIINGSIKNTICI